MNEPHTPQENEGLQPIETILQEFIDNYPEGVAEMLSNIDDRQKITRDSRLGHHILLMQDLLEKRARGDEVEGDDELIKAERTEIWAIHQEITDSDT